MRIRRCCLLGFLMAVSCSPKLPDDYKFLPLQDDAAILSRAAYLTHNASEVIIEADVVVLNSFYRGFDNDYLYQKDFQITGNGTFNIESFDFVTIAKNQSPCNFILLIDQSEDYSALDPYNARTQAMNKFIRDIVSPDKFLIAAAAKSGSLSAEPVEFAADQFGNDFELHGQYLFELSKRTGGSNAILDAASAAIERFSASPPSVKKQIVMLVHRNDEVSAVTADELLSKAILNNVAINTIAFGEDIDNYIFSQLSAATGGLHAACSNEKEVVKVFSELKRLINEEKDVYRIRFSYKPPASQVLQSGTVTKQIIEIIDPFSEKLYSPVFVNVKIP